MTDQNKNEMIENELEQQVDLIQEGMKPDEKSAPLPKEKRQSENKKEEIAEPKKKNKRHKRRVLLGGIFCTLALVGVISLLSGAVGFGKKVFDNTAEKQKYNNLLATLVMFDPLPFETPEEADQKVLLVSSIWAVVMNEDMEQYEKDEYAQTYLPSVDVDKYFAKIFGTQVKLQHQTFEDQGMTFEFNEEKQAYIIPVTNFPSGFTPQVAKIKTSFKEKIVTVGYLSAQSSWADTSERSISKYVDYIFQKQDGQFALVAIRESDMKVEDTLVTKAK